MTSTTNKVSSPATTEHSTLICLFGDGVKLDECTERSSLIPSGLKLSHMQCFIEKHRDVTQLQMPKTLKPWRSINIATDLRYKR
jgi:hypothetical protein